MEMVTIYHPKTGGRAEVPASAVPHHRLAGWRVAKPKKEPLAETEGTNEESS